MDSNDFLEFVDVVGEEAPPTAAPTEEKENPFMDFVESEQDALDAQTRATLLTTDTIAPDAAAKQYKLAKDTGLPITTVRNKQQDLEKQIKFNSYDLQAIQKETPDFAENLRNPALSPVIRDDEKLREIEKQMQEGIQSLLQYGEIKDTGYFERVAADVNQSWGRFNDFNKQVELNNRQIAFDYGLGEALSADEQRELDIINNRPDVDYQLNRAGQMLGATLDSLASMKLPFKRGLQSGGITAIGGAVVGGVAGLATGPAGAAAGATAGARVASGPAFSAGMTAGIFEQELGINYTSFKSLTDKDGVPMDRDVAMGAALTTAVINTGLERFALDKLIKQFPGAEKFLAGATKDKIKEAVVSGENREFFRSFGAKFAKGIGETTVSEAVTEFTQSLVGEAGGEAAKYISGGNYDILGMEKGGTPEERAEGFKKFAGEAIGKAGEQAEQAALGVPLIAGAGMTLNASVSAVKEHITAKETARVEQDVIQQQLDQVRESTTHQISPEIFNEVTKNTLGKQDVYISAEKLQAYFQSGKGDYDEFSKLVPEAAEQMQEALERGGDLILPANKLYSAIVANEDLGGLQADMRLTPDSATIADAQDIYEGQVLPEFDVLPEQIAEFDKEDAFRSEVESKLLAAGEDLEVARQSSAVVAAQYKTLLKENADNPIAMERIQKWADSLRIKSEAETVAKPRVEATDFVLDKLRARATAKPVKAKKAGKPLLAKLRKMGVNRDSALAGELRNIGIKEKGGGVGLFRKNGGVGAVDNWTASEFEAEFGISNVPTENGYVDQDFIIDLLAREQAGERLSDADIQAEADAAQLDDLERVIGQAGLDIRTATNEEIKAALAAEEEGRYNQSGVFDEDQAKELTARAIELTGTTKNPKEAGYITSDGQMLDLSGRHYATGYEKQGSKFIATKGDYLANSRAVDHREISSELIEDYDGPTDGMMQFIDKARVVRVDFNTGYINASFEPNAKQIAVIIKSAKEVGLDSIEVDYTNTRNGYSISSATIEKITPANIKKVFNTSELNQTLFQQNRGQIQFNTPSQEAIITLFKSKDKSTFMHEAGHYFLEMMRDVASVSKSERTLKKWEETKKWLGVEDGAPFTVEQHEKFADGFLRYLEKGEAPSVALIDTFRTFRAWLSNLWRMFTQLKPDVKITKSVQDLFDRMLASDEEIEVVRNSAIFRPDPNIMKLLTKVEREKYIERNEKAIAEAKDALLRKLLDEKTREYKKWWKDERRKVKEEVAERVNQSPLYKLIGFLKDGKYPDGTEPPIAGFKLSRQGVIEEYDKEALKYLPKGIVGKEGVYPSIVAGMFEYSSIDDMFTALMNAPDRKAEINRLADAEMYERYGNSLTDGSLEREALESMQNGDRANQIAYEYEVINRSLNRAKINRDTYKLRARDMVAIQRIKDLRPHLYYSAEVRAARDSAKYLAKQDFAKAAQAKGRQMLNHYLYREALAARAYMNKSGKLFQKIFGPDEKVGKGRNIELVAAARALLNKFGFNKKADADPLEVLALVQEKDPELYERLTLATELSGIKSDVKFESMTLDELVQLTDAVKSLWSLARDDKLIEIDGKKIAKEEVLGQLSERLAQVTQPKELSEYEEKKTKWQNVGSFINGAKAWLRIVESWADAVDGAPNGVFTKYIFNPISDASIAYRKDKTERSKRYRELVTDVLAGIQYKEIAAPELIKKNGQKTKFDNKAELLSAMLNTGNESNLRKMLLGFGWGKAIREESKFDAEGKEILGKVIGVDTASWDAFVNRMIKEGVLTKKDFDFLQDVWDLTEEMKPMAWKAHRDVYGYYPPSVPLKAFTNEFGTYKGGYVPIAYNPDDTTSVAVRREIEAMNENIQTAYPSVGKGFTKSRDERFSAPLALDLRLILTHIDKVTKFSHIQPAVSQVNKILLNQDFQEQLKAFDAGALQEMLLPWMNRASKQTVDKQWEGKAAKTLGQTLRWLRKRAVQNVMFMNIANTAEQVTGLSLAKIKVPRGYLSAALLNYTKSPTETLNVVRSKSQFMQQRVDKEMFDVTQEVDDLILNPTKYEKTRAFFDRNTYIAQGIMQNQVDVTVWTGAYDYAVTQGMTENEAVRYADKTVRLTQSSYSPEDVARFQGGDPFTKLFTTFASYFNMQANLLATEWVKTVREMGFSASAAPRLFYVYFFGFLAPVLVSGLIRQAFSGEPVDEDEDGYLDEFMDWFFGSQARAVTGMVPYAGSVANYGLSLFDDKHYNDNISVSPVISTLENAGKGIGAGYEALFTDEETSGKDIKDMSTLMGLITGVPVQPIGKAAGYTQEVERGNVAPENTADYVRGLATGKTGVK